MSDKLEDFVPESLQYQQAKAESKAASAKWQSTAAHYLRLLALIACGSAALVWLGLQSFANHGSYSGQGWNYTFADVECGCSSCRICSR